MDSPGVIGFGNVGDHSEPGHASNMTAASGLREFACRDLFLPVRGLKMVKIALGNGDVVVVVLKLALPVIVQQPVVALVLVVAVRKWSAMSLQCLFRLSTHLVSPSFWMSWASVQACHRDLSCRRI